ncbi:MAG: BlaI/MecI/CopY family transcriptional regulator [Clostridiales bacterium]|nr:BlaI/MecI/CopY family transcriptional regulator [Clostridiales bacterium]MDR2750368.1 BlaI/MecI/CopY family transcriptional regulator [Clostridiales bacterium]
MVPRSAISDSEYQVMKIIWAYGAPITTNEIIEKLKQNSAWHPKTIGTLLTRLVKKGALMPEVEGRGFIYTPMIQEAEFLDSEIEIFVDRLYGGKASLLIAHLLEQGNLTVDEMTKLNSILKSKLSK